MKILAIRYADAAGSQLHVETDRGALAVPWPCATWHREPIQAWLDAGNAIAPAPGPDLAAVKARRRRAVDARLDRAFADGMAYGGKVLQLRAIDQQNVIAMSQRAALAQSGAVSWPPDFGWRMADNTFLPLPTPADMIAMATAAADEVYRLRRVAWAHKDAIAALGTVEAVEAHDIEAGW